MKENLGEKDFLGRMETIVEDSSLYDFLDSLPNEDFDGQEEGKVSEAASKLAEKIRDNYNGLAYCEAEDLAMEFIDGHY